MGWGGEQTGDSDTVVCATGNVQPLVFKVAHTSGRSICHQVQPQTSQVCVIGSGSERLESGCVECSLGRAGCLCLSPNVMTWLDDHQSIGSGLPEDDPDCTGLG